MITKPELKAIVSAWATADLDPKVMAAAKRAIERIEEIAAEARQMNSQHERFSSVIGTQLAEGEIDLPEALVRFTAVTSANAPVSTSNSASRLRVLMDAAGKRALAVAQKSLIDQAEALIVDHIAARFDALTAEATKVARSLPGIRDAEGASREGPKAAAAWSKLGELDRARVALWDVRKALGRAGLVPESVKAPDLRATFFHLTRNLVEA